MRWLVLFIGLVSISPLLAANTSIPASILVVGDSISAAYGIDTASGWVNLLATKITQEKKHYQVINASISGDTTINALNRFPPLLSKYNPSVVIIELGGNDGLRGLSIKQMRSNLKKMIELSQKNNSRIILAGMKIPPNYGKRYTDAFYKVYLDLSKDYKVDLIPFLLDGIGDKPEMMQADGIHPTGEAQPFIMEQVWDKLENIL